MPVDDNWVAQLVRDLVPFADPSADEDAVVIREPSAQRARLTWVTRGVQHDRVFVASDDGPICVLSEAGVGGTSSRLSDFLAGAEIADLQRMARMIVAVLPEEYYLASDAHDGSGASRDAQDVLREALSTRPGVTNVVFLTANAGAGKSRALRHLARTRADECLRGKQYPLFLYVDAQGRALARLDEAIAVAFADLRHHLHYSTLATLVRHNLLIPIIDGFDELLETSAVDSMSTLSRFLEDLEGTGQLIACARSAFYEQDFARRAQQARTSNQSWALSRVELLGWNLDQQRQFVNHQFTRAGRPGADQALIRIQDVMRRVDPTAGDRAKPFFVDTLCALLVGGGEIVAQDGEGIAILVDAYVSRELEEKFIGRNGEPLLSAAQLKQILTAVAYEMWVSETRSLPTSAVRDIMSAADVGPAVEGRFRDAARQRGRFLACLQASTESRVEFEHDLLFDYFIADEFAPRLAGKGDLAWLLACSSCSQSMAAIIVTRVDQATTTAAGLCSMLSAIASGARRRSELVQENAGRLIAAYAGQVAPQLADIRIESVSFVDEAFRGVTFTRAGFAGVLFRDCGLESTAFVDCTAEGVVMERPRITRGSTRLELVGLLPEMVSGLNVVDGIGLTFRPDLVSAELRSCGLPAPVGPSPSTGVHDGVLTLLERLAETMRATNVIWPEDDQFAWLRRDPRWSSVRRTLLEHGILEIDQGISQKRQQRERLRGRIPIPDVLAASLDDSAGEVHLHAFWRSLRREFPSDQGD